VAALSKAAVRRPNRGRGPADLPGRALPSACLPLRPWSSRARIGCWYHRYPGRAWCNGRCQTAGARRRRPGAEVAADEKQDWAPANQEPLPASVAMIVGPLQFEWPENALECLGAPTRQARRSTARPGSMGLRAVVMVRIEALLYSQRRQLEDLPPDCSFQRFQSGRSVPGVRIAPRYPTRPEWRGGRRAELF
jgi:hypothetical protein